MTEEYWILERFDGSMIRLKNGNNILVLQAKPGGAYDFEEYEQDGGHSLKWEGDVCVLIVTKYDEDNSVTVEITQRNNGFPIALMVNQHPALWDEFKAYSEEQGGQPIEDGEPEDPTSGGRRRKTFRKPRLMSKKYCKKTPCRKMGFTQKASCRPYKNCYQ